jgi:hypothetical protein
VDQVWSQEKPFGKGALRPSFSAFENRMLFLAGNSVAKLFGQNH